MNSMKRQNDRIRKEELPRSVGDQYATGGQWRNNSRKNEGMEQKTSLALGVLNEIGQRLTEFCQENALVRANTLFQQDKRTLHIDITRWSKPKSD